MKQDICFANPINGLNIADSKFMDGGTERPYNIPFRFECF